MADGQILNTDEASTNFSSIANTPTGRKAYLGDPDQHINDMKLYVERAHQVVADGYKKIGALVDDPTRPGPVLKHAAAQEVWTKADAQLAQTQSVIENTASRLWAEGDATMKERFAPDPERAGIQSKIIDHINREATTEGGLARIRALVRENFEVASVISHTPDFLLGIKEETRRSMQMDGVEKHLPNVWKQYNDSLALRKQASQYEPFRQNLKRAWFNPSVAAQASRRVDV